MTDSTIFKTCLFVHECVCVCVCVCVCLEGGVVGKAYWFGWNRAR